MSQIASECASSKREKMAMKIKISCELITHHPASSQFKIVMHEVKSMSAYTPNIPTKNKNNNDSDYRILWLL